MSDRVKPLKTLVHKLLYQNYYTAFSQILFIFYVFCNCYFNNYLFFAAMSHFFFLLA